MTDYEQILEKCRQASREYDRAAVAAACNELVDLMQAAEDLPPAKPLVEALANLRQGRYFDLMQRVADAAILRGQDYAPIRRQYAQALIEGGNISAAISVLTRLAVDTQVAGPFENAQENADAHGLMGRAYKQAYVLAVNNEAGSSPGINQPSRAFVNRRLLERAVAEYFPEYDKDPENVWHGINAVACLCRAERDHIAIEGYPDPRGIAARILSHLEEVLNTSEPSTFPWWHWATAVEACLALGDMSRARDWLAEYIVDRHTNAFQLASTLRQFLEVWQLTTDVEPGKSILPTLRGALLLREGGAIELQQTAGAESPVQQEVAGLQAILGDSRFVTINWYRTGLIRCEAVARIEDQWGNAFGTGFLVRGQDLHSDFDGESLLLTNAHVISDDPVEHAADPPARPPEKVRVRFETRDGCGPGATTYTIAQLIWTSSRSKLDVSVLRLNTSVTCEPPYPLAVGMPVVDKDRVYVIGHPRGGTLSLSIQDNVVVDIQDPKLHYRAPTEPGSSGSPVFNHDWELVALHHAGNKLMSPLTKPKPHPANEGIWISAIRRALQESRSKTGPGTTSSESPIRSEIRAELG